MSARLAWNEAKRAANLAKHGLDFADAARVLDSDIRLDVIAVRHGEERTQSFAYVFDRLAVLMLVHTTRDDAARIISFRLASEEESKVYHEWLENPDES